MFSLFFLITIVLVGLTSAAYYFYSTRLAPAEVVQVDKVEGVVSSVDPSGRQLVLNTGDVSYKVYFYDDSYVVPVYDYVNKDAISGGYLGQNNVDIMSYIKAGSKLMITGFIDSDSFIVRQAYLVN